MNLGVGAIGGKDSMSGSFEKLDVPPTLVSFAVTTAKTGDIISPEFKQAGHPVVVLEPERDAQGLPVTESLLALYRQVTELIRQGKIVSCRTAEVGGSLASVLKMALGNGLGFAFEDGWELKELAEVRYGSFIAELSEDMDLGRKLGTVTEEPVLTWRGQRGGREGAARDRPGQAGKSLSDPESGVVPGRPRRGGRLLAGGPEGRPDRNLHLYGDRLESPGAEDREAEGADSRLPRHQL